MSKISKAEAARLNGKKGGRPRKIAPRSVSRAETPAETHATPETHAPAPPIDNPFKLTPKELLFVEAYCGVANFNASEAYKLAGYKPDDGNASKLTVRYRIVQAIGARLAARVQQLRIMDGDEALMRLTTYARADIGKVLHADDPIAQLPDDVRLTIKSVRPTAHGRTIELYDAMKATELLAKADGKLKETVKVEHSLEEILALSNHARAGAAA